MNNSLIFESQDTGNTEEQAPGSESPDGQFSSAKHEAAGALSTPSSNQNIARTLASAVALLDGDQLPPEINGLDIAAGTSNESGGQRALDQAQPLSVSNENHNQEIREVLIKADAIIARTHAAPIEAFARSRVITAQSRVTAEHGSQGQNGPAAKEPAKAVPSEQAIKAQQEQQTRQAEQLKEVQRARIIQMERQAYIRSLQNELSPKLLADLSKAGEAPKPLEITTVSEALEAKKLAQELGLPLVIDVYATWCGPCQQMDREALSFLEGRNSDTNKPKIDAVYVHIDGDQAEGGANSITAALNAGHVSGYPHVAVFNPPDYDHPDHAKVGGLSYEEFSLLIQQRR